MAEFGIVEPLNKQRRLGSVPCADYVGCMPRRAELGALGQVSTFIVPSGDIGGVMAEFGIVEPLVKQRRLGSVAWIIQRSAESGTAVRLTGLLTAVIAAYHYSLWS